MQNTFIVGMRLVDGIPFAAVMRPQREYSKKEALCLMAYLAITLQIEPRELETAIEEAIGDAG